jgi:hypothetical protein
MKNTREIGPTMSKQATKTNNMKHKDIYMSQTKIKGKGPTYCHALQAAKELRPNNVESKRRVHTSTHFSVKNSVETSEREGTIVNKASAPTDTLSRTASLTLFGPPTVCHLNSELDLVWHPHLLHTPFVFQKVLRMNCPKIVQSFEI